MRTCTVVAGVLILSVFCFFVLTCNPPTNPWDPSKAKVGLILKSSAGLVSEKSITDSTGNIDTIGLVLYLTQYIDSTELEVKSGSSRVHYFISKRKVHDIDTVYYPVSFSEAGTYSVIATGYVKNQLNREATAAIYIVARPGENRKPQLTISGRRLVAAGDTVKLAATATDPDIGQTVTIDTVRIPGNAVFINDSLLWATTIDDTGADTAIFVATDNGSPAKSDFDTVVITVSATPVNRPPVWNPKKIQLPAQPGLEVKLPLAGKCTDADGDALTFSLLPGTPDRDTLIDSTWSFTPTDSDTGEYAVKIVARDPGNEVDTLTIELTVKVGDKKPPVLKFAAPAEDSQTVSSSSYPVMVSGTDESGIALVKCAMGSDTFAVTRSSDTMFSAKVTGLVSTGWNDVRFIAVDSAPAANSCTLYVHLMYDPTIPDNVPPVITLLLPSADTVVTASSCLVRVNCTDDSGVARVSMSIGTDTVHASKVSADGDEFTGTVKNLAPGQYSTVNITAVDSAAKQNTSSISVRIKYDSDSTGPSMVRVTPKNDSVTTTVASYPITISCTDPSGISSVNGALGAKSFIGAKGDGTYWVIPVTDLVANTVNTVTVTATDNALRANPSTLNFYIKYDPTIGDNTPPTVYFRNPAKDTVIGVDTFVVTAICTDASGIASLNGFRDNTPFTMNKSTTVDSIWTGTVTGLPAGASATIQLIATDASSAHNKDTASLRIKYDNDASGPSMTRVAPVSDSDATNASGYTIKVNCTDPSGVASVRGTLGSRSFNGSKGTGNEWTITVSDLVVNTVNTIVVTATDNSLRANPSSLNFYIKYDPTMLDTIGPTIKQISGPASGSVVPNAAIEIIDSIVDPSDIDSVYWTKNNGTKKTLSPVAGNNGQFRLKDTISEGKQDTLVITAVDKSTRHNRSTLSVYLRYINAPAITVQPVSLSLCPGAQAIFSVTATGTAPLSYQWRSGATSPSNISGAIFPRCTLNNVSATTILSCVVSNESSTSATSNLCTLTVRQPPTITGPTDQTTCSGTNATLSVTAAGTNTYQWYSGAVGSGTAIPSATAATYSTATAGSYYCIVTSSAGCSATSSAATVTVNTVPTITGPDNKTICSGVPASLSVTATGGTGLVYQWYSGAVGSGTAINGATAATYSTSSAGSYYCVVSNASGCSATSSAATVTVNAAPVISGPSNDITCASVPVSLTVSASGGTGFTYKWYSGAVGSGTEITGATSASYSTATAGSYYCAVTNAGGCSANSSAATVTVNPAPTLTGPSNRSTCPGVQVNLTVTANGGSPFTYEWYTGAVGSGTEINGATSATYSTATAGSYYCIVTNTNGCKDTSSAATVTVNGVPSIAGPTGGSTCPGYPLSLSVTSSGATGYQWYSGAVGSGTSIPGATSATYSTATAGTYYCVVSNANCSAPSSAATVTLHPQVSITSNPVSTSVCSGNSESFSVVASGGSNITYQWYSGSPGSGSEISGATSSSLSRSTGGTIYCVVSNSNGCKDTSSAATLTVNQPPSISGPANQHVCSGNSATLSVTASGGSNYTYQWYTSGGSPITGAMSSSYSTPTAGSYYCRVTSNGCSANSGTASVTLHTAPSIVTPYSATICAGSSATFTVGAYTSEYTYQWYNYPANTVIPGATSSSYTTSSAGSYYCKVTSAYGCGTVTSYYADLTVNPLPIITKQPQSTGMQLGSYGGFTIEVSGDYINDYTYQWYFNGQIARNVVSDYIGGDTGYMIFIQADPATTGNWYCIATSIATGCSRQTNTVTYSVIP